MAAHSSLSLIRNDYTFKANGKSPPKSSFEIIGGVLIVRELDIATIDHFGATPGGFCSPSILPSLDTIDKEWLSDSEATNLAFIEARELVMSTSELKLHSCRPKDIREGEFI